MISRALLASLVSLSLLTASAPTPAIAQILPAGAAPTKLTPASVGGIAIVFTEGALWDGNGGVYFSDMHACEHARRPIPVASCITTSPAARPRSPTPFRRHERHVSRHERLYLHRRSRRRQAGPDAANLTPLGRRHQHDRRGAGHGFQWRPLQWPQRPGRGFQRRNLLHRSRLRGRVARTKAVYYINPQERFAAQILTGFNNPNGIILSPNGKTLYVAMKAKPGSWRMT